MKQLSALLLFLLLFGYANAQSVSERSKIGALKKEINSTGSDTTKLTALLRISHLFSESTVRSASLTDSALAYIAKAEQLSSTQKNTAGLAKSWLMRARIFQDLKKAEQSELYARRVLTMYEARTNNLLLAEAFVILGDNLPDGEKMSAQKIAYYQRALKIYQSGGAKRTEAATLIKLSSIYLMGGKYQTMIELLNRAKKLYDAMQYPEKEMDLEFLYERFVYAYLGKDNYTEALKYGLQSVRIIERNHDTSLKAFKIYNNVALLNGLLKRYDTQAYFLKKALPIAHQQAILNNDSTMVAQVLGNLVLSKLAQHKPNEAIALLRKIGNRYPQGNLGWRHFINVNFLEAYTLAGKFDLAKVYYSKVLNQTAELEKFHSHQTTNYNVLIKYLMATGQQKKAITFLKLNDTACRNNSQIDFLAKNYLNWFKADSLSGNLKSAITHFQLFKTISDSLINTKKASQLADLQVSYQTEKKDEDIRIKAQRIQLLHKQAQYQEVRLLHEQTVRNVSIAGGIMLLLLLGLSYNRYLLKQRSNQALELSQQSLNAANDALQMLLTEKEWLLKEIHHRVKNNLQIVISLLNTQSAYLDNGDALDAIKNSQHRMHAMSLIHQKLYQSDNLASIDMSHYIKELVDYLHDSFSSDHQISMSLDIAPIKLYVSQAVPLGLILNEAISNSIKYAFKNTGKGKIAISLQPVGEQQYLMCIADNGSGLPEGFDLEETSSLGMSLMRGLTDQLEGEFALQDKDGLRVCITFKHVAFNESGIRA
ncbi:histidine kinase dimerization/phosphoacceptor domain -containing protein [Pedobacter duraquae]|uniref:histidine kinase n=1 Tax=Pedobacter duraquae TaxID=425511 RepID=A0A4R6IPN0_9SPHI|nr:histidine kinase dimerization/phosphoacceptor domain -containing protein [Pedobacter duraquae]TDO24264.1 two-component sensor histidine kinase [Pedobacter duraquae]